MSDKCNMHLHCRTSEIPLYKYFDWEKKKKAPTTVENKKNVFILKEIYALLDALLQQLKPNCRNLKKFHINQCYPKVENKSKRRTHFDSEDNNN